MRNGRKIILILIALILAIIIFMLCWQTKNSDKSKVENKIVPPKQEYQQEKQSDNLKIIIPNSVALKVPFTPQAPTANWDELHNEACEEASSLMAAAYFDGSTEINLKPEFVEQEIDKLTEWQTENYGYYLDTTVAETARMIEEVYNLKTELVTNFSEDDIKEALANGKLVILSANGRLLGNPNFKTPGPIHHMLVITGYNKLGFITNDPGTRKGLNYFYDFETLYNSSADWDHAKSTTDTSIKTIIIVSK